MWPAATLKQVIAEALRDPAADPSAEREITTVEAMKFKPRLTAAPDDPGETSVAPGACPATVEGGQINEGPLIRS